MPIDLRRPNLAPRQTEGRQDARDTDNGRTGAAAGHCHPQGVADHQNETGERRAEDTARAGTSHAGDRRIGSKTLRVVALRVVPCSAAPCRHVARRQRAILVGGPCRAAAPRCGVRCVRIFVTFATIFVTFVTVRTAPSATQTRPIGRRAWRQVAGTRWTEVAPAKQRDRRTWLSFASFHLQCPLRDTIDRRGRVSPVFSSHALGNDGLLRDIRQMFTHPRVPREHQSCLQVFMCGIWKCSGQPRRLQVRRRTHALEDSTRQRYSRRPVQSRRHRHQVICLTYLMARQHQLTPI